MSFSLAVKQSWRYFAPRSLLDSRRVVRQLSIPGLFYLLGWEHGLYSQDGAPDFDRGMVEVTVCLLALLTLRLWAGKYQLGDLEPKT